jgi:tetratricopeptide (TPR) repeat protein
MKDLLALACLLFFSFSLASAQTHPGGGDRGSSTPTRPQLTMPDPFSRGIIVLSGKVVVDDGSVLTESALIQTICNGRKRTETRSDLHGNFSFQLGSSLEASENDDLDANAPSRTIPRGGPADHNDLRSCELQASLPGFVSDTIQLAGRLSGLDNVEVGRLVLHRASNVEGFTISATTAQAPGPALKAFEKGEQQQKKGKPDEAQKSFEKAVSIYPKFAAAWFELGRVQLQKNDTGGARHSFRQSIAADPKYLNPYLGLRQLAQHEQNWQELLEVTDQLLALNPVSFPDVWLSNGVANYSLQRFDAAEKSVHRGLQLDPQHRIPGLEYLLGMILLKKSDYGGAAEHLRAFLKLATTPAEAAEAQKQLAEVARLSAAANVPASRDK